MPAFVQLSAAIDLLNAKRGANLGRREQDLLIDLLLRRAGWRLEGSNKDKGGAAEDARAVIALDKNISNAYRVLAAAAFDDKTRRANDEQALSLDPYNADALKDLADLTQGSDPAGALVLLQRRQRVTTYWSDDYLQIAHLQTQLGKYQDALQSIATSIESAPGRVDLYEERRDVEKKAGHLDQNQIDLHFAQGLHAGADHEARIGNDGLALQMYLRAFLQASSLQSLNGDAKFELDSIVRNLSAFISANYRREDAEQLWQTLARDPVLNLSQQQVAAQEAGRLSQKP